jgi:CRISP-associated protein Cas1
LIDLFKLTGTVFAARLFFNNRIYLKIFSGRLNMPQDYHLLPKLRDSLSYIYIEHAVLERKDSALLVLQETGRTLVPVANLCLLLLGPGTNITHAAILLLAENGCSVMWVGQDTQFFYAQGLGETHRAAHILHQAQMLCNSQNRLEVVIRMYEKRFGHSLSPDLSIEQIRGMEGVRMRSAYQEAGKKYGVDWQGRNYDNKNWGKGDPANRALSAANAVLNGVCHAGIVSGGYSPALGFLHTGKLLSFVYDIADLYKTRFTIPISFQIVSEGIERVESRVREACRERFREEKLLEQILPDIDALLDIQSEENIDEVSFALPTMDMFWQPDIEKD